MSKLLNDDREKPIYSSTRFSDVLAYAEVKDFLRVLFDDEKKLFIYCDGWDYIHIFLGKTALDYGLYPQDMSSKLSKNLGLFEFAISKDYQERLLNQDSYSKVTEYNGFYIYTREGSGLLKNSVFRDIVKPYKKSKEITIEERIRRLEKKLEEKVIPVNKELTDTKLVTSAHELNEIIKHNTESRIVYDKEKNWFLIGNGENSIHIELINDALKDGIYPPFEWNGHIIDGNGGDCSDDDGSIFYQINPKRFVLFRTSSDSLNGEDYYYDRYRYCYIYKDYCVFTRDTDFEETPLYKLLGEPIDIENNGNVLEDERLNESILDAKSVGDELMNIILKNPTRKELSDNNIERARCIEDSEGNWYFADMFDTLHFQIENLLRNNVSFPYYDGNDSYGISYFDVEGNEFWYNSNEMMPKEKCLEQYYKSSYLKKEFPDAYIRENPYGFNSDDYENENIELDESVIPEQVPEKLYHATFSKLLRKIKRCGYLGNSPYKLWSDSNNKYVYLATDPDEAYSYAETALDDCDNERLYDMLEDDDIVILEIDSKYLDKNKLFKDENVVDGETTYQYEGIINCQIMKIYKPTLNESINLHKNNRVAGFFYYKDNKWELLPRTEEIFDMDDDWDDYLKFQHNAPEGWLEEVGAIRFSIETNDNNKTLCVIESPKELWIKPFIKKLYNKFPEEMSMVDLFDVEYQDVYDQTHWKQFSPLDLD